MATSFDYWNDCVDVQDLEAMWQEPEVSTEWLDAGETKGNKVHLSRDPDGEPYLTQTEMKAVADIIVRRHFDSQIQPDMICAVAELASDRQPLSTRWYDKKTKETALGIMQILPKTAEWLVRDLGYQAYEVEGNPDILYRPFVSVYFGAAYIKWLSNFEEEDRSEEFVVRAYNGGTKKATHKSTLQYWKQYLSVKESLPSRSSKHIGKGATVLYGSANSATSKVVVGLRFVDEGPSVNNAHSSTAQAAPATQNTNAPSSEKTGVDYIYWDSKASPEEMQEMWSRSEVAKEWTKSGEKRGKVRFSHDKDMKPYLSRVELKFLKILSLPKFPFFVNLSPAQYFCLVFFFLDTYFLHSQSFVLLLRWELGHRAYRLDFAGDLTKPFVSMYFGAAYLAWLSEYEGRERTPQFVVPAYLSGPKNVNHQETGPLWLKFEQALSNYEDMKRDPGNCTIL
ncbi:hypothetical protein POTOM_036468 [Populus tomentosa]|uniref:Transglycosylase SLT domain-containing protein n=1 Tax=Populus tomentosa TaxID=118781 RepID=A0A8X7YZQ0_POPTO|nr:hypothetical protein POTOM_036468 [Populus tomentosa]